MCTLRYRWLGMLRADRQVTMSKLFGLSYCQEYRLVDPAFNHSPSSAFTAILQYSTAK